MKNNDAPDLIIDQIRKGGQARAKGITALYRYYAQPIKQYFINRGASKELAEDLVQEVFVTVIRKIDDYKGEGAFSAWLWAIARNSAIDEHRKESRRPPYSNDEPVDFDNLPSEASSESEALNDCVREAFNCFAKEHTERAQALSLHALHGWKIEDVATFLGRTHAATREYLSQCRKRLSPFLAQCQEFIMP